MSKSLGNVINPDDIVKQYGADVLRLYEMFMGPLEDSKVWNTKSIIGLKRFLEKIFRYFEFYLTYKEKYPDGSTAGDRKLSILNKTIKKVTENIENLRFNTAISQMMILSNELFRSEEDGEGSIKNAMPVFFDKKSDMEKILLLLSPFAPHITEDIWSQLGNKKSIFLEKWPGYDPKLVVEKEATIVIQVNGKVRDQIAVSLDVKEDEIKKLAFESEKIKKYIPNIDNIRKIIFVPGRLINFVV